MKTGYGKYLMDIIEDVKPKDIVENLDTVKF